LARFIMRQWTDGGLHTDPLPELTKLGQPELQLELRLTHEQDLQQLLGRRLEVREQPDLLEGLRSQVLGFVENQHRLLTFAAALDQEAVESGQPLGSRAAGITDSEILQRVLEDPVERQQRVGDERDRRAGIELSEERVEQ